DAKENLPSKWEYRVLTKEQLAELGKKNLAAGLNKIGEEGWELVTVQSGPAREGGARGFSEGPAEYYFKRPVAKKGTAPDQPLKSSLDQPAKAETKFFLLKNADVVVAATTLQLILGKKEGLVITADPRSNQLVVRGSVADLADITAILEKLDVAAPDAG